MVPNSLGPAELLLQYGTDEQKDHYLPRLADGRDIPCFGLTGPFAGSDATAIPDTGVICHGEYKGERVLGMRANWEKRYITLGPVATVLGLALKVYDPDGLLGGEEELGITCALIPTDTEGVEIGRRHDPLGTAFQNGPNSGTDVFIPLDWVIGGREGVGRGWVMLMECLSTGRGISLPALGTGGGKFCSRNAGAYARVRRQFNLPIGRFEGIEEPLARIGAKTYMMDSARLLTLSALDAGEKPSVVSAILKHHNTEGLPAGDQRRHGRPRRQGHLRGPEQLPGQRLPRDSRGHHGRGREHPHPQHDRVRPGRDALPSLPDRRDHRRAERRRRAGQPGFR
ncbi:MAG: acyl-CoA dehydrogenase family protein [Halofilum sp. (in: g-proteobacteria)]|nr:acyl-CoA dehydrogenase family protein [Halofilum sp. (in: g-proteobacteria)]